MWRFESEAILWLDGIRRDFVTEGYPFPLTHSNDQENHVWLPLFEICCELKKIIHLPCIFQSELGKYEQALLVRNQDILRVMR